MVSLYIETARFKSPGHKNELCFFWDTLIHMQKMCFLATQHLLKSQNISNQRKSRNINNSISIKNIERFFSGYMTPCSGIKY